jgi:hypothetical protein
MDQQTERTTQSPIQLDFRSERKVVVTPKDENRFVLAEREAAQACQHANSLAEFSESFQGFLVHLREWSEAHADNVKACYVSVGMEGIKAFLVVVGEHYRYDLDDMINALDVEIANKFPIIIVDVLQIQETGQDSLSTFFSPTNAMQVYDGTRGGSPREG